jgi:hypothetical protein
MKRAAFSSWPALAVVSIVLLFIILFVLTADRTHTYPIEVRQKAQLHSMEAATELFANEWDSYPPSDANDPTGKPYCGAMTLTEALMGRDLLGFHRESVFRRDGLDPNTLEPLYPTSPSQGNLRARMGPYLMAESANAWQLADIYGKGNTGPFPENTYVLCDVFERKRPSGARTGMPILYYRANRPDGTRRNGDPNSIYDCTDNLALIALGIPGKPRKAHPLIDPKRFYLNTQDHQSPSSPQPYRSDSYILISAGEDGLYGTADDICNFNWKYRQ